MKKLLFAIFIILLVWLVAHVSYTIADGLIRYKGKADLAVVLGNKVNEDGTLSKRLAKRLSCAFTLYKAKQVDYIMVSGGLGKEGFLEGDKMRTFLLENGIPDSIIIVDNEGDNTLERLITRSSFKIV